MNTVDNLRKLDSISKYHPFFEVTAVNILEEYRSNSKYQTPEGNELFSSVLSKLRLPFNKRYIDFYSSNLNKKPEDIISILTDSNVNIMIGVRDVAEIEVETISKYSKNFDIPTYNVGKYSLKASIDALVNVKEKLKIKQQQARQYKEENKELSRDEIKELNNLTNQRWLYEHWLEHIVIFGLRRKTIVTGEVTKGIVANVMNYNNMRRTVARQYFKEGSVERIMWENRCDLEDKFLAGREDLDNFYLEKIDELKTEYSNGNKDAGIIQNQLIDDYYIYKRAPIKSPESVFQDFLQLYVEDCPVDFIFYRSMDELNTALWSSNKFLNLFNNINIKKAYNEYLDDIIEYNEKNIVKMDVAYKFRKCLKIYKSCGIFMDPKHIEYYDSHR